MLTREEQLRCLYHLDYTLLSVPTGLSLGDPQVVTQARFVVQQNLALIDPNAEGFIRTTLGRLDCIESEMDEARGALIVERVGDTKLRDDALDQLELQYRRWRNRLADLLAGQQNPVSNAAQGIMGGGVIEGY